MSAARKNPPRSLVLLRQDQRATLATGDWADYQARQRARRARRRTARVLALSLQIPRGCVIVSRGDDRLRITTPRGQAIDWDPLHQVIVSSVGTSHRIDAAGVARIVANLLRDEAEGIVG